MDKQETLEYLETVIKLEKECYSLQKVMAYNETQRIEIKELSPPLRYPDPPNRQPFQGKPPVKPSQAPQTESVIKVSKYAWDDIFENIKSAAACSILPVLAVSLCVTIALYMKYNTSNEHEGFGKVFLLLSFIFELIILSVTTIISYKIEYRKARKKAQETARSEKERKKKNYDSCVRAYHIALENYNCDKKELERRYQERCAEIKTQHEEYLQKTNRHNLVAKNNNDALDSLQNKLTVIFLTMKTTLDQIYDVDVVYPKYCNLIAVASFYEYLDSGRCDELEGKDGAYNIFELELRLDRIIYELDLINVNLSQIQKNQYRLYCEMVQVNRNISKLTENIRVGLNQVAQAQGELYSGVVQAGEVTQGLSRQVDVYVDRLEGVNREVLDYLAKCKSSK